jgi:hypothetical protein
MPEVAGIIGAAIEAIAFIVDVAKNFKGAQKRATALRRIAECCKLTLDTAKNVRNFSLPLRVVIPGACCARARAHALPLPLTDTRA